MGAFSEEADVQGRVLVVDDEIDLLNPLCDILAEWGHEVTCYTSCKIALEKIRERAFDLLMTDLSMPEMSGIDMMKEAKQIDPNLVCIIITGHATTQIAIESMKIGAFDFVLKPFNYKMLRRVVSRAVEVGRMQRLKEVYRSIVEDYQTEMICRFLPDGTLTFVNDAYCSYFDQSRDELIGKSFVSTVFEEDREKISNHLAALGKANPTASLELRFLKKTGEIRWQQWVKRAIFDKNGLPREVQAIGKDITERKLMEEALKDRQEKLRNIIEHSNELFYSHDTQNRLTYVSPQSVQILGFTPQEMMVEWTKLTTDNPINKKGVELTEAAIKTGEKQRPYLLELYRKDGTRVMLEIDESPLKDEEGKVIAIIGAARDVTERQRAEAEIKKRMKELEEFYSIAVNREIKMKELKEEIENLKEELRTYKELEGPPK
ncbi:MAG: PAS domain S-box protein [Nitrospirota bacterium]